MYKVNDGEWKEEVPTAVNAGTYTVYYKACLLYTSSFSIRIVIYKFLPKRSHFLPETQTILHYLFYSYFPNVLLDLAAAFAAMVLVDSNKEVVGATGDINTRPVPR